MKTFKLYLKLFVLCAAGVAAAACASQNADDKIVLGTPSVISEMSPVTTAPVKVEELDVAPPQTQQPDITVGDNNGPRPAVPSIQIAQEQTSAASNSNIDVQVEGTGYLNGERPVVPSIRVAPLNGAQQTAATAVKTQQTTNYRQYTLGAKTTAFKYASAELTDGAKAELKNFLAGLKNKKYKMIYIGGHTDSSGDEPENITLSENRALAVADFFAANNIPRSKITYKGYGSKYPVAPNTTNKNRAKNRRVDILVK
ncbi:MAG: OmpA family protein [Elusimicrobium sp.]|jgi:outer membrane protein OmpA-like peptidoglycan-associated protein|nr:OmpA family protein [Elusimicrobium sp.]